MTAADGPAHRRGLDQDATQFPAGVLQIVGPFHLHGAGAGGLEPFGAREPDHQAEPRQPGDALLEPPQQRERERTAERREEAAAAPPAAGRLRFRDEHGSGRRARCGLGQYGRVRGGDLLDDPHVERRCPWPESGPDRVRIQPDGRLHQPVAPPADAFDGNAALARIADGIPDGRARHTQAGSDLLAGQEVRRGQQAERGQGQRIHDAAGSRHGRFGRSR
ncbi:MAG: hypothetical protein U1F52_02350 [Burkholderiales bacterium]